MNAIISGTAEIAIIIDGDNMWTLSANDKNPNRKVLPSDLHHIIGYAKDLRFLEDVEAKDIAKELHHALACEQALQLGLMLLDPTLSDSLREKTACVLEQLTWNEEILEYLFDILYSTPLPKSSDINGALGACQRAKATLLYQYYFRLQDHQKIIRDVSLSFQTIPHSLFSSEEERKEYQTQLVKSGDMRIVVQGIADSLSFEQIERSLNEYP